MKFNKLFERWKKSYSFNAFVSDGIVDPKHYESPHILFVLRDMNCQTECNLCQCLLTNGCGWKTWNNIGRWSKALLDGDEEYPWDMSKEKRMEQLKRVAVMNLKKEGGYSRTSGHELLDAVQMQHKFIYDEICLCEPDIIVCCGLPLKGSPGNADLLWKYVFPDRSEWDSFHSVVLPKEWYFYYALICEKQVPVISFCHPQSTNILGHHGHKDLFSPLYQDMLYIRKRFILEKNDR